MGRVGSIDLKVRVIAASQVDIETEVHEGRFRADLFWRLNVLRIEVPPLRECRDDILFLARRFTVEQAARMHRSVEGLSAASEEILLHKEFPGNVRELQNMIERAVTLSSGPRIQEFDLIADEEPMKTSQSDSNAPLNVKANVESAERAAIVRALSEADSVLHLAAEHLRISRKTLWEKMRRYEIVKD